MSAKSAQKMSTTDRAANANRVELLGHLTVPPEPRTLPSGDELVSLRVSVLRPDGSRRDSLPVTVGPAPTRGTRRQPGQATAAIVRLAAKLDEGDTVIVNGWLRRRFWDTGGGLRATRIEVVAETVQRG